MAIRYYLSPMIGTGTEDDPFRPVVADLGGVNWVCVTGTDGAPALVLVNAPEGEHQRLRADLRHWAFPRLFAQEVEAPDRQARMEQLERAHARALFPGVRDTIVAQVASRLGLDLSWLDSQQHSARDVIKAIGKHIDINFSEAELWVSD